MNPFPSFLEFSGLYNILPEDCLGEDFAPLVSGEGYIFCSQKNIPNLTQLEVDEIREKTNNFFVEWLIKMGVSKVEATRLFGRIAYDIGISDRSIRIELDDRSIVKEELVLGIQKKVLKNHPLWRIIVLGEEESTAILIYPEFVRVGDLPPNGDWVKGIEEANKRNLKLSKERTRELDRQIALLAPRIPNLLSKITNENPFEVVGIFVGGKQRFDEETDGFKDIPFKSIWVLVISPEKKKITLWVSDESNWPGHDNLYGVNTKGEITRSLVTANDEIEFPFNLMGFYIPEGFVEKIYVIEFDGDHAEESMIRRKWPLDY